MKKLLTITAAILLTVCTYAQDKTIKDLQDQSSRAIKKDEKDTVVKTWKKGGQFSLNGSQASLSNWAAGGDDFSLAITAYLNLYAFYKKGKHSWDNNLDVNFGYVNTTSTGARKNDDRIDFLSKYGYELNPKLNLAGLFNFRTQMAKGYEYTETSKTLLSDFFAPAYLIVSLGLDYHPVKNLSIFMSPISSRWTFVENDSLSAAGQFGVDSFKHVKNEIGAYVTVNYTANLTSTVSYKGRLDLFSNYKHKPQNIDIFFTNMFAVKISRVLSATWSLDIIYDDDVRQFGKNKTSPGTQLKSLIGAGLLVRF
ncbi:DUF3078 domain-containing protein [Deminuibacter soli]|uniref:DUF3078 domain-containing protein n=1 Tax=Deminuibacter soli TaxID=2291815 RepID=A0A3E1NR33_9BACT|nr:DUF3078 domain-containing protein [Deminuibacter soli]RFM30392.1 DUF3078 domain-containing protein [Deminuibacter soli]